MVVCYDTEDSVRVCAIQFNGVRKIGRGWNGCWNVCESVPVRVGDGWIVWEPFKK